MKLLFSYIALISLGAAVLLTTAKAGGAEIATELSSNVPAGNVIYAFEGQEEMDGWGWYRGGGERRDVGFSFRSPADDKIQKITCRIQNVPHGFREEEAFTLEVYQTQTIDETPTSGEKVYSGRGKIALQTGDKNSYLTFVLDHPLPIASGAAYTVFLSWDGEAESNIVSLGISPSYLGGLVWYREGKEGQELKHLNQSDNPGVIFYIQ